MNKTKYIAIENPNVAKGDHEDNWLILEITTELRDGFPPQTEGDVYEHNLSQWYAEEEADSLNQEQAERVETASMGGP